MTIPHAVRQLVWHLQASGPVPAPAWLSPAEAELFRRMPPADQVEGVAVAERLASWGYERDRNLLVAGLLHDSGKSLAPNGVQLRIAATVIEGFMPGLMWPLLHRGGALGMLWNHPATGAELAAKAGLCEDVVALIREHHLPAQNARLLALQRADALH